MRKMEFKEIWWRVLCVLPEECSSEAIRSVLAFMFDGVSPSSALVEKIGWIYDEIDDMVEHRRKVSESRRHAGRKGSDSRWGVPTETPSVPVPEVPKSTSRRFSLPSIDEVREYIEEKGYHFDAETFHAFYESNGWKVGKNPMKNWRAACVTWETKRKEDHPFRRENIEETDKPKGITINGKTYR